jgi:hypothetical protein
LFQVKAFLYFWVPIWIGAGSIFASPFHLFPPEFIEWGVLLGISFVPDTLNWEKSVADGSSDSCVFGEDGPR